MKFFAFIITMTTALSACSQSTPENDEQAIANGWQTDFFDDFETFNPENWQDQRIWVNNETHCYVPDNEFGTREVSDGSLKIKVVNIGEERSCDNFDKHGNQHPDTQYVAGRIASRGQYVPGLVASRSAE
jgi:hypothetical protein